MIQEPGIDHLLYVCADLERGMDEIEALLGVRPVRGGRHPQYGTHNALLSLGPGVYLEIIARDPELTVPQRGALIDVQPNTPSRLITWVYRTDDIRDTASRLAEAAIEVGSIASGHRMAPDGSEITWQLTDPYAMPMCGAFPFLIDWGDTVHPSAVVPTGGRLVELTIEHPEPKQIRSALALLGVEIDVIRGEMYKLRASIEVKEGIATLR